MSRKVYIEFTKPDLRYKKFPVYSYAIRAVECTEYSHVRLRWQSTSGVEIIYEASGTGVKVIGKEAQSQFPVEVVKCYEVDVANEEYRSLIRLFRYASVTYGILQAFGILLVRMFNKKKNPFSDGRKSQVCSELVGLFLIEVKGWEIDFDLDVAGPKAIDKYLERCLQKYSNEIREVA